MNIAEEGLSSLNTPLSVVKYKFLLDSATRLTLVPVISTVSPLRSERLPVSFGDVPVSVREDTPLENIAIRVALNTASWLRVSPAGSRYS